MDPDAPELEFDWKLLLTKRGGDFGMQPAESAIRMQKALTEEWDQMCVVSEEEEPRRAAKEDAEHPFDIAVRTQQPSAAVVHVKCKQCQRLVRLTDSERHGEVSLVQPDEAVSGRSSHLRHDSCFRSCSAGVHEAAPLRDLLDPDGRKTGGISQANRSRAAAAANDERACR